MLKKKKKKKKLFYDHIFGDYGPGLAERLV